MLISNKDGITLRQLRDHLNAIPEEELVDNLGDDVELWIDNRDGTSRSCTELERLNWTDRIVN